MNCLHCNTKLIHGGDQDGSVAHDGYDIISNLSCPNCNTYVYVEHTFPFDDDSLKQKELFKPEMWEHYCDEEHSMMEVGKGEPCNWCGERENESST